MHAFSVMDTAATNFVDSVYGSGDNVAVTRKQKGAPLHVELAIPRAFKAYKEGMRGIDAVDQRRLGYHGTTTGEMDHTASRPV